MSHLLHASAGVARTFAERVRTSPHAKFGDCFTAWLLAMPNGFFDLRIHIPCVTIAPDFVIFLEEA